MRPSQIRLLCLTALIAAQLVALPCRAPATAHEQPTTTPAARFLQDSIAHALILTRPPVAPQAGPELQALFLDSMDWPTLTQFAIGRYATGLGEDRMGDVTISLERQLESMALRVGREMPTMTIAIHSMRIDSDGSRHILSTATVPRFGEVEVEWTLVSSQTGYRIADIRALGLTLRQFLRSWVTSLVAARDGDAAAAFENPPGASSE